MQKIIIACLLLVSCAQVERKPSGIASKIASRISSKFLYPSKRRLCSLRIAEVLTQINPADVHISQMEHLRIGNEIGEGQAHIVYAAEQANRPFAFLRFRLTDPDAPDIQNHLTKARITFNELTQEELQALASISINDARAASKMADTNKAIFIEGTKQSDPRNKMFGAYLRELADISYMWQIARMQFGTASNPFPAVKSFVFDSRGIYMGHLMDVVPGKDLESLLKAGAISKDSFEQVIIEVHRQLDLLETKGLVHGDLDHHLGNIMVDLAPNGHVRQVTLIDFAFSVALSRSPSHKIERRKFRKVAKKAMENFF